ncbi:hypothetical protein [Planctomonas deserti]|uniref:hypothetical protein n=1 Tax=Planctomonas deserti TaxID=2144185 RepID=UPI00131EDDFF|nr:hypothetical protein [Planctomonas deserti]
MPTLSPADLPSVPMPVMTVVGVAVVLIGAVLMAVTVGIYRFTDTPVTRRGFLAFCSGLATLILGFTVATVADAPAEKAEGELYESIVRSWLAADYGVRVTGSTARTLIEESDCGIPGRDEDGDRCGAFFMAEVNGESRHVAVHLDEEHGRYVLREIDGTLVPPRSDATEPDE